MEISTGPYAHQYAAFEDDRRLCLAELRAQEATKGARILRRQAKIEAFDTATSGEDSLYGPGVDDSM